MRQIRQALRLHFEAGLTYSQIGRALGISKSTAGKFMLLARTAGIDWPQAQQLSDEDLEATLFRAPVPRSSRHLEPDFSEIHQELKRPGVTLMLLWEEYARGNALAYKYTSFCIKYRAFAARLKRSMRQAHIAGEKLFVDYAGQTLPMTDANTGEIRHAQIFVAVLGASNYTYACATETQSGIDWVNAMVGALHFIGGVPRLIVPDQTRALIARPDRYEPEVNRLVEEFCEHYATTVLPARPAHPRDKPKVEVGVQVVERWILARLRHQRFFSLTEINSAIAALLIELNARAFKKLPGSRASAFNDIERDALKALPSHAFVPVRFKRARVNIDYHLELEGHFYSVPHRFVGSTLWLRISAQQLEIFADRKRVAVHALNRRRGAHSTQPEHMPASHRAHAQWSPQRLIDWGTRIGPACGEVVRWQLHSRPHPEQGYRSCLGLMRLSRQFGPERLEAACARALLIRAPQYRSVKSILDTGLDRQSAAPTNTTEASALPAHENVRGPQYYH